jgi:hypothetical protein
LNTWLLLAVVAVVVVTLALVVVLEVFALTSWDNLLEVELRQRLPLQVSRLQIIVLR